MAAAPTPQARYTRPWLPNPVGAGAACRLRERGLRGGASSGSSASRARLSMPSFSAQALQKTESSFQTASPAAISGSESRVPHSSQKYISQARSSR